MKSMKTILGVASIAVAGVVAMCGCSTPTIPLTMNVAGEIKLTGVSKIALVDFNSLPDDPFTGQIAADAETCALVQRTVASAFYKVPTYQIANLSDEEAIAAAQNALPNRRFDAIVCGRLWWQITPETDGKYIRKFTLDSWVNVPYMQKVSKDKAVPALARVPTQKKDVLCWMNYRTRSAALMLSLGFYRVGGNGEISKIVDTYQVTEQGFTLMDGEMKTDVAVVGMKNDGAVERLQKTGKADETKTAYEEMFGGSNNLLTGAVGSAAANAAGQAAGGGLGGLVKGFGGLGASLGGANVDTVVDTPKAEKPKAEKPADANAKVILTQNTVTMPTELQAKLMLAAKLSDELAAKIAPSEVTFDSPWMDKIILWCYEYRFDAKLTELVKNRAWEAMKQYAVYQIRQNVGKELSEKIAAIADIPATYPVAKSEKSFKAEEAEDMIGYFKGEDVPEYLYALAIAQEATGDAFGALDSYTESFNMNPTKGAALGISRCNMSIGQAKRINVTNKEKNKAAKKAKLD